MRGGLKKNRQNGAKLNQLDPIRNARDGDKG